MIIFIFCVRFHNNDGSNISFENLRMELDLGT